MDNQRMEQIDRWAEYVKKNPNWKKHHTAFINAQFEKAEQFWEQMLKEPGGKEKLREIYNVKNPKAVPQFF